MSACWFCPACKRIVYYAPDSGIRVLWGLWMLMILLRCSALNNIVNEDDMCSRCYSLEQIGGRCLMWCLEGVSNLFLLIWEPSPFNNAPASLLPIMPGPLVKVIPHYRNMCRCWWVPTYTNDSCLQFKIIVDNCLIVFWNVGNVWEVANVSLLPSKLILLLINFRYVECVNKLK